MRPARQSDAYVSDEGVQKQTNRLRVEACLSALICMSLVLGVLPPRRKTRGRMEEDCVGIVRTAARANFALAPGEIAAFVSANDV